MQSLKSPVTTHCVGYAYNLAAFLLAAGEKVKIFPFNLTNSLVLLPFKKLLRVILLSDARFFNLALSGEDRFAVLWLVM